MELGEITKELAVALNRANAEAGSNTPDFILAEFLVGVLTAWNAACQAREKWYASGK